MGEAVFAVLSALFLVNLFTFLLFGWDKWKAHQRSYRVPEATLLRWAFLGSYPGAKLGQLFFRHKTRKQPFARQLNRIGGFQAAVLATGGFYWFTERDPFADFEAIRAALAPFVNS